MAASASSAVVPNLIKYLSTKSMRTSEPTSPKIPNPVPNPMPEAATAKAPKATISAMSVSTACSAFSDLIVSEISFNALVRISTAPARARMLTALALNSGAKWLRPIATAPKAAITSDNPAAFSSNPSTDETLDKAQRAAARIAIAPAI